MRRVREIDFLKKFARFIRFVTFVEISYLNTISCFEQISIKCVHDGWIRICCVRLAGRQPSL